MKECIYKNCPFVVNDECEIPPCNSCLLPQKNEDKNRNADLTEEESK